MFSIPVAEMKFTTNSTAKIKEQQESQAPLLMVLTQPQAQSPHDYTTPDQMEHPDLLMLEQQKEKLSSEQVLMLSQEMLFQIASD